MSKKGGPKDNSNNDVPSDPVIHTLRLPKVTIDPDNYPYGRKGDRVQSGRDYLSEKFRDGFRWMGGDE